MRWDYQDAVDKLRARLASSDGKEKLHLQKGNSGASLWNYKTGFQSGLFALEGTSESQRRNRVYHACLQYEKGYQYSWRWDANRPGEGVRKARQSKQVLDES